MFRLTGSGRAEPGLLIAGFLIRPLDTARVCGRLDEFEGRSRR